MAYTSAKSNQKKGFLASVLEFIFLLCIVFAIRTLFFGLYKVPTGSMETTMLVGESFFANKFTYLFSKPARGDIIAFNDPLYRYSDNFLTNLFQRYVWGPSNWTKRVIGVPGDRVHGVVEDGKPEIYLTKQNGVEEKLVEPYLNKYPLIREWKQDPAKLRAQLMQSLRGMVGDPAMVNELIEHKLLEFTTPKTYVPGIPFDKQPYYLIKPDRIWRVNGEIVMAQPGTPILSDSKKNGKGWNGSDIFDVTLGANQYWLQGDNRQGSKDSRWIGPVNGSLIHGKIVFRIWSIDSDESWWFVDLLKHPIDFWKRIRWSRFFQRVR